MAWGKRRAIACAAAGVALVTVGWILGRVTAPTARRAPSDRADGTARRSTPDRAAEEKTLQLIAAALRAVDKQYVESADEIARLTRRASQDLARAGVRETGFTILLAMGRYAMLAPWQKDRSYARIVAAYVRERPRCASWSEAADVLIERNKPLRWLGTYLVRRVIDGDTIEIEDPGGIRTRVRLRREDAPELDEPGGPEAKAALADRLLGRRVRVVPYARDRYGRLMATVEP